MARRKRRRAVKVIEKKLGREHARGQCYMGEGLIVLDPRQRAKEYCNSLLHELLHHVLPNRGHSFIYRTAGTMTEALWDAGFRRMAR